MEEREHRYPDSRRQSRLVQVIPYQDDLIVITIGGHAAQVTTNRFHALMRRLGIPLSTKADSNREFSNRLIALGAHFIIDPKDPRVIPKEEKVEKFGRLLSELESKVGRTVPIKQLQELAGLMEFLSRFTTHGPLPVNEVHACLRVPLRTKTARAPVSYEMIRVAKRMLQILQNYEGAPLVADARFHHFGQHGFSTDPRGLSKSPKGGWGLCIAGKLAYGEWDAATRRALKDGVISINPLELLGCGMAIQFAIHQDIIGPGNQVIWRSDNEAAICDLNRCRARSGPMLAALKCVQRVIRQHRLIIHAQHIAGEDNVIADLLSRRQIEAARTEALKVFGDQIALHYFPQDFSGWTETVIEAGYRSAGVPRPAITT